MRSPAEVALGEASERGDLLVSVFKTGLVRRALDIRYFCFPLSFARGSSSSVERSLSTSCARGAGFDSLVLHVFFFDIRQRLAAPTHVHSPTAPVTPLLTQVVAQRGIVLAKSLTLSERRGRGSSLAWMRPCRRAPFILPVYRSSLQKSEVEGRESARESDLCGRPPNAAFLACLLLF